LENDLSTEEEAREKQEEGKSAGNTQLEQSANRMTTNQINTWE
jgi:hypothetical protein